MKKALPHFAILLIVLFFNLPVCHALTPLVDSIPMSDGRKLAADVYIPSGVTSGPVILIQTPYNRQLYRFSLPLGVGLNLNSSNYIFVIVDWRGFYGSSAAAYSGAPAIGADGHDVVEWIAQQSWSNGKIGTWGASALGRVQFQTAETNPPHLTCICPLVAGPQYDYSEYFPNGDLRTEYVEQLNGLGFGIGTAIMPHPVEDLTWTYIESLNDYPDSIRVPCYMIGGWYDHTIQFMLPFFNEIHTQSPVNVRNEHRLLMGPWVHKGIGDGSAGQITYSNATSWSDSLALLYFDYHLRNIANNWDASPFVQYYQMGDNTWQTSPTWPPANVTNTNFYFEKTGLLDTSIPANTTDSLSYNYDPNDPSPTVGGPTLNVNLNEGPYDQAPAVESRNDILSFTTNTLTQDAVMKGSAVIHLKVSSKVKDTDFDIRLTDVYPDGRSMLVNDGVMRMRFRNGTTPNDTAAMVPGTIYDCVITLPASCITFLTGHKIRVDVTSSNYPRFNRNMNTDGNMYPALNVDTLVNPVIAMNTVYANSLNESYISLPLVGFITGLNETKNNPVNLEIYPNPASTSIKIAYYSKGDYVISVFNTLGEDVMIVKNQNTIDVSKLRRGLYYIQINDGNDFRSGSFTKQ